MAPFRVHYYLNLSLGVGHPGSGLGPAAPRVTGTQPARTQMMPSLSGTNYLGGAQWPQGLQNLIPAARTQWPSESRHALAIRVIEDKPARTCLGACCIGELKATPFRQPEMHLIFTHA